jgi:uncharacterized protein with gpF-like domain
MLKERKKSTFNKFVKQKRMETNRAEVKGKIYRNFYVYGKDDKNTYMTVIENTLLSTARKLGQQWARENDLKFERVVAFKK